MRPRPPRILTGGNTTLMQEHYSDQTSHFWMPSTDIVGISDRDESLLVGEFFPDSIRTERQCAAFPDRSLLASVLLNPRTSDPDDDDDEDWDDEEDEDWDEDEDDEDWDDDEEDWDEDDDEDEEEDEDWDDDEEDWDEDEDEDDEDWDEDSDEEEP